MHRPKIPPIRVVDHVILPCLQPATDFAVQMVVALLEVDLPFLHLTLRVRYEQIRNRPSKASSGCTLRSTSSSALLCRVHVAAWIRTGLAQRNLVCITGPSVEASRVDACSSCLLIGVISIFTSSPYRDRTEMLQTSLMSSHRGAHHWICSKIIVLIKGSHAIDGGVPQDALGYRLGLDCACRLDDPYITAMTESVAIVRGVEHCRWKVVSLSANFIPHKISVSWSSSFAPRIALHTATRSPPPVLAEMSHSPYSVLMHVL